MKPFDVEYKITDYGVVEITDEQLFDYSDLVTCLTGDLSIQLGDSVETFEDTALIAFSEGLIQSAWHYLTFAHSGDQKIVTILDHSPVFCMRLEDEAICASIEDGGLILASSSCQVAPFLREIGRLHKSITEQLLSKNPALMNSQTFRYFYPGANYFAFKGFK